MHGQLQTCIDTLAQISCLNVTHRAEGAYDVFDFCKEDKVVKTCFTYDDAKLFAEGIKFGMEAMVAFYTSFDDGEVPPVVWR